MKSIFRAVSALPLSIALAVCAGCGGGDSGEFSALPSDTSGEGQTLTFGNLSTRIAGTVQPPVTAGEAGVVVTGVAGGNVSNLILRDTLSTLSETRIAFTSERDGNREIYTMNPEDMNVLRLTKNSVPDDFPRWSPNGDKILFLSLRNNNYDLYVINADGTGERRLTSDPGEDSQATWSPDGMKIVFTSNRQDNNYEIYVMNADGSNAANPVRLTTHSASDVNPVWSPDGSKILFESDRAGGNAEIYEMNAADGSSVRNLTQNPAYDGEPAWSPDGKQIVFRSYRSGSHQIHVMYADGTGQIPVTTTGGIQPHWSADGHKIVFHNTVAGNIDVFAINADGSGLARLTDHPANDFTTSWSPFPRLKTLIGNGGVLGTTAAGFLFGQSGNLVQSVVAFNAAPQTSARVLAQTPSGSGLPNVIFTISADSLTSLAFVNSVATSATSIIGAEGVKQTATGAIVSFNAATGYVSAVLPYTANRAAGSGAPSVKMETDVRVLRGKFLGVWDGKGKNRAPNGATEVRLDARTGSVVRVQ